MLSNHKYYKKILLSRKYASIVGRNQIFHIIRRGELIDYYSQRVFQKQTLRTPVLKAPLIKGIYVI